MVDRFDALRRLLDIPANAWLLLLLEMLAGLAQRLADRHQRIDRSLLLRFKLRSSLLLGLARHLPDGLLGLIDDLAHGVLGLIENSAHAPARGVRRLRRTRGCGRTG